MSIKITTDDIPDDGKCHSVSSDGHTLYVDGMMKLPDVYDDDIKPLIDDNTVLVYVWNIPDKEILDLLKS